MTSLCRKIADLPVFQGSILALIIFNAMLMGVATIPEAYDGIGNLIDPILYLSQVVFGVEILIRFMAFAPRFREFFHEFWNRFDLVIVLLSFVPAVGSFVVVARLLRILRVLRLISVSNRLRDFADRVLEFLDEAIGAAFVAFILGYIFALSGYYLFSESDPTHWGSLSASLKSVFYLLLLQNVASYVEPALQATGAAVVYFILLYFSYWALVMGTLYAALVQSGRRADG
jgi:voltage-gated sodium channel